MHLQKQQAGKLLLPPSSSKFLTLNRIFLLEKKLNFQRTKMPSSGKKMLFLSNCTCYYLQTTLALYIKDIFESGLCNLGYIESSDSFSQLILSFFSSSLLFLSLNKFCVIVLRHTLDVLGRYGSKIFDILNFLILPN